MTQPEQSEEAKGSDQPPVDTLETLEEGDGKESFWARVRSRLSRGSSGDGEGEGEGDE